jgi:prepilin-type N-terminal cleavage/methylation domain-containing protein
MIRQRGFTLIEVLIALAIGTLVFGIAAATTASAGRVNAVLEERTTAMSRTTAVPQLLIGAIGRAGRGIDGCGLEVLDAGRLARTTAIEVGDEIASIVDVLAGVDGAGRAALYHRTSPYPRQPWLEDVTAFNVVEARDQMGEWGALLPDDTTRWTGLRVEVAWLDGDVRTYDVPLPHAPCAAAP